MVEVTFGFVEENTESKQLKTSEAPDNKLVVYLAAVGS